MLSVNGLVGVASDHQYEEIKRDGGSYLNFNVVSEDDFPPYTMHKYRATMWVPTKELEEWREVIKPGSVFLVKLGNWAMREWEGGKFPIANLKLDRFQFKKLAVPYWGKKKEE